MTNNENKLPNGVFSTVKSAYKPSGKMPLLSLFLMVVFGAIITGSVILLFTSFSLEDIVTDIILIDFIGSFCFGAALGLPIGFAIYLGGRIGKNRNRLSAIIVGILFGLIAPFAGFQTGCFKSIGILYSIIISFTMFVFSVVGAYVFIEELPFCETCQQYMKELEIKLASLSHGTIMLSLLQANNYHEIIKLTSTTDPLNHCKLNARYCNKCYNGYVFMFIVKYGQHQKEEQLVFSSPIKSKDLQGIIKELNNIV